MIPITPSSFHPFIFLSFLCIFEAKANLNPLIFRLLGAMITCSLSILSHSHACHYLPFLFHHLILYELSQLCSAKHVTKCIPN